MLASDPNKKRHGSTWKFASGNPSHPSLFSCVPSTSRLDLTGHDRRMRTQGGWSPPFAPFGRSSDFDVDFSFDRTDDRVVRSIDVTRRRRDRRTFGRSVGRSVRARTNEREEIGSGRIISDARRHPSSIINHQSWGRTCPNQSRRRIRRTARRTRTRTERRRCRDGERTWRYDTRTRWCLFSFWLLERAKPTGAGVDLGGFVDDRCGAVQSSQQARAVFWVWLIEPRRRWERGTRNGTCE